MKRLHFYKEFCSNRNTNSFQERSARGKERKHQNSCVYFHMFRTCYKDTLSRVSILVLTDSYFKQYEQRRVTSGVSTTLNCMAHLDRKKRTQCTVDSSVEAPLYNKTKLHIRNIKCHYECLCRKLVTLNVIYVTFNLLTVDMS